MIRTRSLVACAAALALVACQKPETADQMAARMRAESDSAKTAIEAAGVEFMRHFAAGRFDSVATFYTADAVVMPPNTPTVVGREAIQAAMAQGGAADLRLTTQHVVANGPVAIEHGTFTFTGTPPGATAPVTGSGKYLAYWTRTSEGWKMQWDIWNDDAPMAMPPAPPRRRS